MTVSYKWTCLGVLVMGSCFSPNLGDGDIPCGEGGLCPDGFECRIDNFCHDADSPDDLVALEIDPPNIDFGALPENTTGTPLEFTVFNPSSTAAEALSTMLSGTNPDEFQVVNDQCSGTSLAPGEDCTFEVSFTPMGSGDREARVTVSALNAAVSADLQGMALAQGDLLISEQDITFPDTDLETVQVQTIDVTNNGEAETGPLEVTLEDEANFIFLSDTCTGQPLAAGGMCSIDVGFQPITNVGDHFTAMTIVADPGGAVGVNMQGLAFAELVVQANDPSLGTITSNPAGIDCPNVCSARFNESPVELIATPNGGVTFAGFSGACAGPTCFVDLVQNSTLVTADFAIAAKHIFLSSRTYTGNIGGLQAADDECDSMASAAGLAGTYKAWLSDSSTSAAERMSQVASNYQLRDGTVVAVSFDDLIDGALNAPINLDESGTALAGGANACLGVTTLVWTGTRQDGSSAAPNNLCSDWTAESVNGTLGNFNEVNSEWTELCTNISCQTVAHIYCVEQ